MINNLSDTSEQNGINMDLQVRTQDGQESFSWTTDVCEVFRDLA